MDRFDVSLAPGEPARLMSVEESAEQASDWFMKSLTPEDGYVAALAVKESDFCPSYSLHKPPVLPVRIEKVLALLDDRGQSI